ncbi:MAG: hypothetical protein ACM3TR_10965 [Caulobacteraceae bacterium]
MIKAALEYLVNLGKTEVLEVDGQKYSTKGLHHITQPSPDNLVITTLTGLVDYIISKIDDHKTSLLMQVVSPKQVRVYSPLKPDAIRDYYIECTAQLPDICFGKFIDIENFNIMLQSCFVQNEHSASVLQVVGNITEQTVRTVGDDGVSQEVTARAGIVKVTNVPVPNPVILKPFRTFAEVEQPESKFVFRMQDGPRAAIFEADGGAWKLEAMRNIKEYLKINLEGCNVKIIS